MKPMNKDQATGCLLIILIVIGTNLVTFGLGYLIAWLIHT